MDIQRFCTQDGPGIRSTVFLKGCNLRCQWCHNPESFQRSPQLGYSEKKCVGCGSCVQVCPQGVHRLSPEEKHEVDFKKCTACGNCVEVCPAEALRIFGNYMEVEEVLAEVRKDRKFYERSQGGVTFSGGEAAVQFEFLLELLDGCKREGISTALETNGAISMERAAELCKRVDLFLLDFKLESSADQKKWLGVSGLTIRPLLECLLQRNKPVILRCPIIPGINDTEEHFSRIRALQKEFPNIRQAEIMAYHDIGKGKWSEIGLCYQLGDIKTVPAAQKEIWEKRIRKE